MSFGVAKSLIISSILPLLDNANDFVLRRRDLLSKPTITEHQIASRIAETIEPADKRTLEA